MPKRTVKTQDWYTKQRDFTPAAERPPKMRDFTPLEAKAPIDRQRTEEELIDKIAKLLASGMPQADAARSAGVDPTTVSRWFVEASKARGFGERNRYVRWVEKLELAETQYIEFVLTAMNKGLERKPDLALEILRRRRAETYAEPATQVAVRAMKMTEEELEQHIRLTSQALEAKIPGALKLMVQRVEDAEFVEDKPDE